MNLVGDRLLDGADGRREVDRRDHLVEAVVRSDEVLPSHPRAFVREPFGELEEGALRRPCGLVS